MRQHIQRYKKSSETTIEIDDIIIKDTRKQIEERN